MARIETITLVKGKGNAQDQRVVNRGSAAEADLRKQNYIDLDAPAAPAIEKPKPTQVREKKDETAKAAAEATADSKK